MSSLPRALHIVLALLFFYFASLQIDDANPAIYADPSRIDVIKWVAFYGLTGILFIWAAFRQLPLLSLGLAGLFSLYLLVQSGPGLFHNLTSGHFDMTKHSMSPSHPAVEQSREFFGALIAAAGQGFLAWRRRRADSTRPLPGSGDTMAS